MGKRPMCVLCLLLIAFLCLTDRMGFSLIRGNPLPENLKAWIREHPDASVCGEVESCADTEFSQSVYLKNTYLICDSEKVSIDNIRVFLKKKEELPVGSVILVSGRLEEVEGPLNPGEFDSRQYYACRHIYYFLKDGILKKKSKSWSGYGQFLADVKERFREILRASAGGDAPVYEAIVLGDKSELDEETKLMYQLAGIIHILAISGLHISMLGMGLYELLKRLGLGIWPAGFLSLVLMLQYGMMTGGGVSAMRAVSMFLLATAAKILGRIYDMLTGLAVAGILILVESPAYLLDGGFLLSFSAVIGAGIAAPRLCSLFKVKRKGLKALVSSLAVQLVSFPVMLWFYGEASLAGIFLNLVVIPSVGVVLLSGVGTALAGLVSIPLAKASAVPGRGVLLGYHGLCVLAGKIPFSSWIAGRPQWWQIAGYYAVLLAVIFWEDVEKKIQEKNQECIPYRRGFCAGILILGIVFLVLRPCGRLEITCLDVGQGDGIVVETPESYCFLIDGGSSDKNGVGRYQILPYLKYEGISRLDGMIVTHTDEDHISGVRQILEFIGKGLTSLKVDMLVLPKWETEPEAYEELRHLAEAAGVKVLCEKAGDRMRFGKAEFSILSPKKGASGGDVNEDGLVFMLEYEGFRGLFTGDAGVQTEKRILAGLCDVDFLKVGHHGSRYSTSEEFLAIIQPEVSVISCGLNNRYGHPHEELLQRLKACGTTTLITCGSGAVTVRCDENSMEVEKYGCEEIYIDK